MALEIATFDEELLRLIGKMQNNDEVKSIIEKKDLYNVTDSSKNTLLHVAAQKNTEITRYLIDSGSRVDARNEREQTPLMLALATDREEIIEVLLKAGANVELQDNLGKSALQMIGKNDAVATEEVLGLFFQKLQIDSSNNKEEIAKKLIDARWPLEYIACLKDSDLTKIILQRGYATRIDALDGFGEMALHFAVESVDVGHVKLLLEYNANVNFIDDVQRTPLCYLYRGSTDLPDERLDILKMLLDRGAILSCIDYDFAAYDIFKYAHREAIKLLFQSNIDQHPDFRRVYALHALAENENPGAIQEIRDRGFNVNERRYHSGQTALMMAAICGNAETVEFLLNEGADTDIDVKDFRIFSALFYAINKHPKSKQIVQMLLERDADVQYEIHPLEQHDIRSRGVSTILDLILKTELFSLGELVLAHLALQETLGPFITETIRAQIDACDRFKTYYESSNQQLSMKIYEFITLFDVLTATDKKLEGYARNEEFVSKNEDARNALSNHCYFRTILQKRLSKAVHMANLKYEVAQVICKITGMNYDRYPLIADNIISYLEHKDMIYLIDASL